METREYQVRFLTPAFLGNAEQNGQWRTPPFKALLRQWWRVAYAAEHQFRMNVADMRREEGRLFGAAADGTGNRSLVRLRLDRWDMGSLSQNQWTALVKVDHPEVKFPVDAGLYMGYGPVTLPRGQKGPTLKANAAIQHDEAATLRLAFPPGHAVLLDRALQLIDRYGTIGGRSRNAWGSFELIPREGAFEAANPPTRDWRDCLDRDWPHALGKDDRGALIWRTEAFDDWKALMRRLAEIKIGLRTQFKFPAGKPPHKHVQPRHWLSYPITTHRTSAWPGGARLPNSLRFKVRADADGLRGVIFHVPCLPPSQFKPDRHAIEPVWQQVHGYLDSAGLQRIPA